MKKNQKGLALSKAEGFTVIELIVVIAIIAVLSSIVLTNVNGYIIRGKLARASREAQDIGKSLQVFFSEHNEYPTNDSCANNILTDPVCIKAGGVDPNDGSGHNLSEFHKFDWTIDDNASFFKPGFRYNVIMLDTNSDNINNCNAVVLCDGNNGFHGMKAISCEENCLLCSFFEGLYPIRYNDSYYFSFEAWCPDI